MFRELLQGSKHTLVHDAVDEILRMLEQGHIMFRLRAPPCAMAGHRRAACHRTRYSTWASASCVAWCSST